MEEKILYYLDEVEAGLAGKPVPPRSCEVNPSNRCMLRCSFCIFRDYMDNSILPLEVYRGLIESFKECGVRSITFTGGGEPLTHPDFSTMADLAVEAGIPMGLVTNGVLLNKLEAPERFAFIRISLDSATRKTYRIVKGADRFVRVLENIDRIAGATTVGISYVVCAENNHELDQASELGKRLGVNYVQFKPAWTDRSRFTDYITPAGGNVIVTNRHVATTNLPCIIAGLVGIIEADGGVCYCCQHKGEPAFRLGTLKTGRDFLELWNRRPAFTPDVSRCPHCRYMNYAVAYEKAKHNLVIDHRWFL